MKRSIILTILSGAFSLPIFFGVNMAYGASSSIKLPYAKGESFVVVQGYNTPPTHIKKDTYALDFSQDGCQAYGKSVVAAAPGKVMFMSQNGYNGGYGTELIIDHGAHIVSRYAHMIPDSITVAGNGTIKQGQIVGSIGDTGLVAGAACGTHPGTHLHFAMDVVNNDGTFTAYDPEPISGYTTMTAGKWYLSDNGDDDEVATGSVFLAPVITSTTSPALSSATPLVPPVAPTTIISPKDTIVSTGGVSVVSDGSVSETPAPPSTPQEPAASSTPTSTPSSTPPVSSSTLMPIIATSSILFTQSDDGALSAPSWYGDNWFDLGNGFTGTLNELTLEGEVNGQAPFASHVALQEFKDPNYTAMIQQFIVSDDAPFTSSVATATFSGLSISLKPYFYYRLTTSQDRQNMSVILAGTPSTTTGIAMHNNFFYGTGRVESTSTFFPYMTMAGATPTSTLVPPALTTPTNLAASFDKFAMQIDVSFSASTDPEWPANPLYYEINYSTSTTLDPDGWKQDSQIPVAVGNTYLIGARARDHYGAISGVATTSWNFPAGFVPYLLSPGLSYANQYFMVNATATLQSIELYTTNFQTSARNPLIASCSLALFFSDGPNSWETHPSDNNFGGPSCAGNTVFSFASSSLLLVPGVQYQWIYEATTGNPSTGASVQFYGTATNTAGGLFNDPSLVNAKFTVNGDSGVLFVN